MIWWNNRKDRWCYTTPEPPAGKSLPTDTWWPHNLLQKRPSKTNSRQIRLKLILSFFSFPSSSNEILLSPMKSDAHPARRLSPPALYFFPVCSILSLRCVRCVSEEETRQSIAGSIVSSPLSQ